MTILRLFPPSISMYTVWSVFCWPLDRSLTRHTRSLQVSWTWPHPVQWSSVLDGTRWGPWFPVKTQGCVSSGMKCKGVGRIKGRPESVPRPPVFNRARATTTSRRYPAARLFVQLIQSPHLPLTTANCNDRPKWSPISVSSSNFSVNKPLFLWLQSYFPVLVSLTQLLLDHTQSGSSSISEPHHFVVSTISKAGLHKEIFLFSLQSKSCFSLYLISSAYDSHLEGQIILYRVRYF